MTEKNLQDSTAAGRVKYRPGPFTRINLLFGVAAYSLLPMVVSWPAIQAGRTAADDWMVIVAASLFLQIALWFAVVRCGSKELPFWEGVALVAGYLRTGWLWADMLVGGLGVFCLLIVSGCIALTPRPRTLYYRVLHIVYRNRLIQ